MAGVSATLAGIGGIAGAVSGASGGGGGGGMPRWQRRAQEANYHRAQDVPIEVAGFTPDQRAAQQAVRDFQGYLDGDLAGAQATAADLAGGVTKRDIRSFYNPFEDDVVGQYLKDVGQMHSMEDLRVNDRAEAAGAFGGDREAVYRAVSQGVVDDNAMRNLGAIRSHGYEMAGNMALQNHGLKLGGNEQLQALIQARLGNRGREIGMLAGSGAVQQALNQSRANIPLERQRLLMEAANQMTGGPRDPYDPIAGAISGFQGGYQTFSDMADLLNLGGGSAMRMPSAVPMANLPPIDIKSDPLVFGNGPIPPYSV